MVHITHFRSVLCQFTQSFACDIAAVLWVIVYVWLTAEGYTVTRHKFFTFIEHPKRTATCRCECTSVTQFDLLYAMFSCNCCYVSVWSIYPSSPCSPPPPFSLHLQGFLGDSEDNISGRWLRRHSKNLSCTVVCSSTVIVSSRFLPRFLLHTVQ